MILLTHHAAKGAQTGLSDEYAIYPSVFLNRLSAFAPSALAAVSNSLGCVNLLRGQIRNQTTIGYRVGHLLADLGWVDLDLVSSPGWWAATVAIYCPGRMMEHSKSKSTQPRSASRCPTL